LSSSKLTPGNIGRLQIVKPDQINWLNILIYGDAGVGKTRLAASASVVPELSPVLLIDFEAGTLSIRKIYPDVDVVKASRFEDLVAIRDSLSSGSFPYKTVIIDSITEIQKVSMDDILELGAEGTDKDPDKAEWQDWGKNLNQVRKMVRSFKALNCHVIMTALAQSDKDNRTIPELTGKASKAIPGQVDLVFYMRVAEVPVEEGSKERVEKRFVLTSTNGRIFAKDRSDTLPKIIEEPTMQLIFDHIMENEG
jgi:hypothetical protein